MGKYDPAPRRTSSPRLHLLRLVVVFLFASLVMQADTFAVSGKAAAAPIPPAEKLVCQYGQWETEYWDDSGMLGYQFTGDPNPQVAPAPGNGGKADFTIGKPTLLTVIIDVHLNPNLDATHVENTSPGSLALIDDAGNYYGPYEASVTSAVNNGKADATLLWAAPVDHVELAPGHYMVIDSDPASVLVNTQSLGVPATIVKGVDAQAYANYMDALVAASEPEASGLPQATTPSDKPAGAGKVTYSKPQALVYNPPDPSLSVYPANSPSFPCAFVTKEPMMVTKIMDYHINNGKGAQPGMIGLQEHDGAWYGSWHAYGQAVNGIPNATWVVTPNFEIPAGSYQVRDNETSTLSADANNKAMCEVKVAPAVTNLLDNLSGKYTIDFMGDDGTAIDYPLILAIIDHKTSVEVGMMVEGYGFKFSAPVTGRENSGVTARYSQGFGEFSLVIRMTFTKKAQGYSLSGSIIILANGQSGTVGYSGARTSTDLPGFIPQPHAGIGKVGSIPGPASAGQAAAGIAFPTLATLIAGSAAALAGGGYGGGYGGDTADSSSEDGGVDSSGDDGGTDDGGTDTGGADTGDSDIGSAETGVADGGGGGSAGAGVGGNGSVSDDVGGSGANVAGAGGYADASPVAVSAPAQPAGPQDGQTMSVHDYGDGTDKTYVYHADTAGWINPLTGGAYVAANYATSAQDHFDTDSEIKKQAEADAYALTEGMNKSAMQVVEDGRARVRLLAEIQKTQRAIYNTPGAEGEGPISSSDRMNSLAEKVASHEISVADAQALLNRQQQYNGDIHVGKAGTQAAADLAASQDTAVAAIGHMEADAGQGAYNAVTDVQGKTTAGVAVRLAAGYLTDGASEVLIYIPANIAIKANENMDAGDSATRAFASAFIGEGLNQAAQAAVMYTGGAALKGAANALGIKPGLTLPASWVKGAAGKTAAQTADSEVAKAAEAFAAHNAEYRAAQQKALETISKLDKAATNGNGSLAIDEIKAAHSDTMTRRTLSASGTDDLKTAYNQTVDTQINKPAIDHAAQSLTEKYTNISDPADPGYQIKKLMDDGYKVKVVEIRTPKIPKPGEKVEISVNADHDVAGYLEKVNEKGKIDRIELNSDDVMTAHSQGFGKSMQVYDPATKTFNAAKASSELGVDFTDPKVLTKGMSGDDLAKFGVKDINNLTPEKMPEQIKQLQLNKYATSYGEEVAGPARPDFARDFSNAKTVMKTEGGNIGVTPGEKAAIIMEKSGGQGGLVDPQGLAFMERNKVVANWNAGTVNSQAEAMQSLGKIGDMADKVAKGYENLGVQPLPPNLAEAVKIARNTSLSPAERALEFQRLNVGDPLTVADKVSAYIEGAKMALPKK